jgi:dTDP-4-amino-4,6-dideoxygalactose transaminase
LGAYRDFKAECPVANECAEQTMAIPLHNQMSESDYVRVVSEIKRIGEA